MQTATGAGGAGFWATTTDDLIVYPSDTTDVVVVGASATTSVGHIFEVSGGAFIDNATTTNLNATTTNL